MHDTIRVETHVKHVQHEQRQQMEIQQVAVVHVQMPHEYIHGQVDVQ